MYLSFRRRGGGKGEGEEEEGICPTLPTFRYIQVYKKASPISAPSSSRNKFRAYLLAVLPTILLCVTVTLRRLHDDPSYVMT